MSFASLTAPQIWEDLYDAYVPDFVTINTDYIRKFGVASSGNAEVDKMMASNLTFVKIPIIKILEYHDRGVGVQIPKRADMIAIHKAIERYLEEWRGHLMYDLNINRNEHKALILSLEKLSKVIYDKAYPAEVVDAVLRPQHFGLPGMRGSAQQKEKELVKPDYNGIGGLLKPAARGGRYG